MTLRTLFSLIVAAVLLVGLGYLLGSLRNTSPGGDPTRISPEAREAIERVPEWGDFAGAPDPIDVPGGGEARVVPEGDGASRLEIERPDGTRASETVFGPDGRPVEARSFDEQGNLEFVITTVRALPGPARPGAAHTSGPLRVRCGSASRRNSGWRVPSGPFDWRLRASSVPRALLRAGAVKALRRAHATWNANRTHCPRLRDASKLRFRYRGTTRRGVGRNNISSVGFGSVAALGGPCAGAVACTLTWLNERQRVIESDTRFNRSIGGGFAVGRSRSAFDLQSVMTHEAGHTVGFGHVAANDNVMYGYARRGDVSARRLGKGDALINNLRY